MEKYVKVLAVIRKEGIDDDVDYEGIISNQYTVSKYLPYFSYIEQCCERRQFRRKYF